MSTSNSIYEEMGVKISKKSISKGDEITISYDGLLYQSGAQQVYAHWGFGDSWEHSSWEPMELKSGKFNTKIKVVGSKKLNVCFKDAVNNWDNNSQRDYSFTISEVDKKSAIKSTTKIATVATKTATTATKTAEKKPTTAKKTTTSKTTGTKSATTNKSTTSRKATKK